MRTDAIWVEDRQGTRLPFSKGILASSLMTTGVSPETAHSLALATEDALVASGRDALPVEELVALVQEIVEKGVGESVADLWSSWIAARRAGHPILVLIGGATGVGKSTVATRLAGRLGITRIIPTDAVREVLRGAFPSSLLNVLHLSSFEAHRSLRAPLPQDDDAVISGFRQQTELLAVGIRRLVDRAVRDRMDLLLEGVHLVPGLLAPEIERWKEQMAVADVVLTVPDAEIHRAHFLTRMERVQADRPSRYLDNFEQIRGIQRYIRNQAKAFGVEELVAEDLDTVTQELMELVVRKVIETWRRAA